MLCPAEAGRAAEISLACERVRRRDPETVNRLTVALASWRYRRERARRVAAAILNERRVVSVITPDATANRPEQPHQITAARRDFDQIVGIGRVGDHHVAAVDAERKRAERLQTFERLARLGAGTHAARPFGTLPIPRAQLPSRIHRGAVDCK